ncbi:hypothetical protein [Novosphingobium malaysiense]|uniref:Energy transducer TonB n=1 Tax=Novosphingobium malaysiense TaxID=1348853 RepID=A0A0B1ZV54_9SPHN|nr:hypothetical protein [Novosphingobium malaysiense]KHK93339.1 hypothetical protein LK12_03285 [Novosphingobium malaysiense]
MISLLALSVGAGLALAAAPYTAPNQGDKVRLDDFAVSKEREDRTVMTQISEAPPLDHTSVAEQDRKITVAEAPHRDEGGTDLTQLASPGETGSTDQVVRAKDERGKAIAPISGRKDSKPEPVSPVAGHDACDPQARTAQSDAQCQRILELRSDEFHATEAPRLSAEQKLLAQQELRERKVSASAKQSDLLTIDPDDPTAQQLAATALQHVGSSDTRTDPAEPASPVPQSLQEVLQSLIVDVPPPSGP